MRRATRPAGFLALAVVFTAHVMQATPQSSAKGRRAYEARCVSCHGADGTGGGHGPSIVDVEEPRARSTTALQRLIRRGIPEAGMPAFVMQDEELNVVVAYVELLRAPAAAHPITGDAIAGEQFFSGKGDCARCHMIRGQGGILGPDLSNLARERKTFEIERALRESPTSGRFSVVAVQLQDGRTLRGVAKYETKFDIGLLTSEGSFRSLSRAQIASVTKEPSLMPKVDASPDEIRNLMAFLTRLTMDRSPRGTLRGTLASEPLSIITPRSNSGEWSTYHGDLSGNRHSPLDQINVANVPQLAPKWTFPVPGAQRALQVTPVVTDGLMYVTSVNAAWALDARTGQRVWHYRRPRTQGLVGDAAGGINRGVAVLDDRVFMVTDHAHLIALHRLTGALLWDTEMADYRQHYGATSAPLVVDDLVVAGVSGGDEGNRGFLAAYNASTGERVWRFWTVPARGEPGSETWIGKAMEHGCASPWLTGTYDRAAGLLYWPTGNPCPDYNGDERQGDNLYSDSVVALDPKTGRLKWYFQFTPHDVHDWDASETPMLVDTAFHGQPRKLLLHADRNGFFYVLDRLSGELLLAKPFVSNLTWAKEIGRDGRPILLEGQEPTALGTRVCPSVDGATNWPATAYSSATGLFYLMAEESCGIFTKNSQWWERGKSFYGGTTRRSPNDIPVKYLRAIDIQTGKVAWEIPHVGGSILASGLLSTAGGLIFYGDSTGGAFVAADARTGRLLWHFETGQSWKASPMTYVIDGKQYIGIAAGATIMAFGLP